MYLSRIANSRWISCTVLEETERSNGERAREQILRVRTRDIKPYTVNTCSATAEPRAPVGEALLSYPNAPRSTDGTWESEGGGYPSSPQIHAVGSPHYGVKVKFCVAGIFTGEGDGVWVEYAVVSVCAEPSAVYTPATAPWAPAVRVMGSELL